MEARRRLGQERAQHRGETAHPGVEAGQGGGIRRAQVLQGRRRLAAAQHQVPAIAAERDGRQILGGEAQAVAGQVQLRDHPRVEVVQDVGAGRQGEAGRDLLVDRGAADLGIAFEHQHPAPGPGQVGGADQAVMTATHHDDVLAPSHDRLTSTRRHRAESRAPHWRPARPSRRRRDGNSSRTCRALGSASGTARSPGSDG